MPKGKGYGKMYGKGEGSKVGSSFLKPGPNAGQQKPLGTVDLKRKKSSG